MSGFLYKDMAHQWACGLPHVGAIYTGKGYKRTSDRCAICGRPATNVHHLCGRGEHSYVTMQGDSFKMRSALMLVCGSGVTGCHGKLHSHELEVSWVWNTPLYGQLFENGQLFDYSLEPHSPDWFDYGFYVVKDRSGVIKEIRL